MKYDVYVGNTYVGKVKTLGTRRGNRRLINIFGTIATDGLMDREDDIEGSVDLRLAGRSQGSWKLRRRM